MWSVRLALLGALLLPLDAFAGYGGLMAEAEKAARNRQWEQAIAKYEEAAALKPKKTEPAEGIAAAKERAVAEGVDAAKSALARGDWEEATAKLDWVEKIDPDVPDVVTLRKEAEKTLTEATAKAWASADPRGSYALAVRLKKLFPKSKSLDRVYGTLRDYYTETAEKELKAKRFEPGLAAIRTITEFEPDQAALIKPVEDKLNAAWADEVMKEAKAEVAKGNKGAGAMLYARAHQISGRQPELASGQALAKEISGLGAFTVDLAVSGSAARTASLKSALETALGTVKEGKLGTANADVQLRVLAPEPRCTETVTTTAQSKDYSGGRKVMDNPEYAKLQGEIAAATRAAASAKLSADAAKGKLDASTTKNAAVEALVTAAKAARDEAAKKEADAKGALDAAQAARTKAENTILGLGNVPGQTATIEAQKAEIVKSDAVIAQSKPELAKAATALAAAEKKLAEAEAKRAALGIDVLQKASDDAAKALADALKAKDEATAKLQWVPAKSEEEVKLTFRYDQKAWTRTCVAKATATSKPKWKSALPPTSTFEPSRTVTDTSNPGHAASGVVEDPKAYPKTDAELIAEADKETAEALAKWLLAHADEHYPTFTTDATAAVQGDPRTATTNALALLLGAPGRLSPVQAEVIRAHLKSYGVTDAEKLLATP